MKSILKYHQNKYPLMETIDYVKLLYQSNFGPNHFTSSISDMEKWYDNELDSISNIYDTNLYEHIGNFYIRVNMNIYSKYYKPNDLLKSMLVKHDTKSIDNFKENLKLIPNDGFLDNYDYKEVNHSLTYKDNYYPHYRVTKYDFLNEELRTLQLQNYLDSFSTFTIFALEGKCASGKTTISNNLKDVTIIDVDEFFLRRELKTKDRLSEIGGNIDYELYLECIKKIKPHSTITYTIFDCKTQSYSEKTIFIKDKVLLVGVYSYHPMVRKYIDKLCFLMVDKDTQMERINKRSLREKFINEWIPLEERYYNSFDFIGNADILI